MTDGAGKSSNNRFKVTTPSLGVRRHSAPTVARRDKRAARVRAVTSATVEAATLTILEHSCYMAQKAHGHIW